MFDLGTFDELTFDEEPGEATPPTTVALRAQSSIAFMGATDITATTALEGAIFTMTTANASSFSNIFLTAFSVIQTKARAQSVSNTLLNARNTIQVMARGGIAGVVLLSARASTQTKATASITRTIWLTGSTVNMVKARAQSSQVLLLFGRINVSVYGRLNAASFGPIVTGYEHIVKFIGNVGHFLIR